MFTMGCGYGFRSWPPLLQAPRLPRPFLPPSHSDSMTNDPLRDSSMRQDREETSGYAHEGEARMQRRREREAPRAVKAAATKLFVLDTNVLMHDPTSLFRFEEHDVFLPMVVLEELDDHKKGLSEASRNVRQITRFLDEMIRDATKEHIDHGLQLPSGYSGNHGKKPSTGH